MIGQTVVMMGISGATLVAKFALMITLSQVLSLEDLGRYGLMTASTIIFIYLIGFQFYAYVGRQIVDAKKQQQAQMIINQLLFHGVFYVLFLPLAGLLFITETLPYELLLWFPLVLFAELISQESSRLMIFMNRPKASAFVNFMRSGLWAYILVVYWWIAPEEAALWQLWLAWSLSAAAGALPALWCVRHLPWRESKSYRLMKDWIQKGVKVSFVFFIAGAFATLAQHANMYVIQHYLSLETVGIYTFYIGLVRGVQTIVRTSSTMPFIPKLLHAHKSHDEPLYRSLERQLVVNLLGVFLFLSSGGYIILTFGLPLLDNEGFTSHLFLFLWLLPAMLCECFSEVPNQKLYAFHRDRLILIGNLTAFIALAITGPLLTSAFGLSGAAIALSCSTVTLWLVKWALARKLRWGSTQ